MVVRGSTEEREGVRERKRVEGGERERETRERLVDEGGKMERPNNLLEFSLVIMDARAQRKGRP